MGIKYRFWNNDNPESPIMEYGSTDDLDFVKRSIGKEKMICIADLNDIGINKCFYEKDICKCYNTNKNYSNYQYYGIIVRAILGHYYQVINPQNMYDGVHGFNVHDEVIGNTYETPELLKLQNLIDYEIPANH